MCQGTTSLFTRLIGGTDLQGKRGDSTCSRLNGTASGYREGQFPSRRLICVNANFCLLRPKVLKIMIAGQAHRSIAYDRRSQVLLASVVFRIAALGCTKDPSLPS